MAMTRLRGAGSVGVVEHLPNAKDQPPARRLVKVRTPGRHRKPQQRRRASGRKCYDEPYRPVKMSPAHPRDDSRVSFASP